MQVISAELSAIKIITPKKFGDHRGFFSEVYSRRALAELGVLTDFVQDNHSLSVEKGVLRVALSGSADGAG